MSESGQSLMAPDINIVANAESKQISLVPQSTDCDSLISSSPYRITVPKQIFTDTAVKSFQLHKDRALQKKMTACNRDNPLTVEVKNGGIRIYLQTGAYELIRQELSTYYSPAAHPTRQISFFEDRDASGVQISQRIKISGEYTINLYHTTSSMLVNGKREIDFLNKDLPLILENTSEEQMREVNSDFQDALTKLSMDNDKNSNPKCKKCKKDCKSNCVLCDVCRHWGHYYCERLSQNEVAELKDPESNRMFYKCKMCLSPSEGSNSAAVPINDSLTLTSNVLNPDKEPAPSIPSDQPQLVEDDNEASVDAVTLVKVVSNTGSVSTPDISTPDIHTPDTPEPEIGPIPDIPQDTGRKNLPQQTPPDQQIHPQAFKLLEEEILQMKMVLIRLERKIENLVISNAKTTGQDETKLSTPATQIATESNQKLPTIFPAGTHSTPTNNPAGNISKKPVIKRPTTPPPPPPPQHQHQDSSLLSKLKEMERKIVSLEQAKTVPTLAQITESSVANKKPTSGTSKEPTNNKNTHEQRQKQRQSRSSHDQTWFRGQTEPLSNLHHSKIHVFNKWYPSSEHAYQHKKCEYHNQKDTARYVLQARTSVAAMKLGRRVTTTREWDSDKDKFMLEILHAKLKHCPAYKARLQETANTSLHEDTDHHHWGGDGGKNRLGELHMQVRNSINSKPNHSEPRTQQGKKPTVRIIGDSNTRFLDPTKMSQKYTITTQAAAIIEDVLPTHVKEDLVVLHVGTNNIRNEEPHETVNKLLAITSRLRNKKIVISKLLPREGADLNRKVTEINRLIETKTRHHNNVTLTDTSKFYHNQQPNNRLFKVEHRNGRKLPLLHLNTQGQCLLSRQMQAAIRRSLRQNY